MDKVLNTNSFSREDIIKLFNLDDDDIQDIKLKHQSDSINIEITLSKKEHACPVCDTLTDKVKAYSTKKILHSLLTNYPCYIVYRARRYICHNCNKTFYEHNPFSHENMKISVYTVSNVLSDLKSVGETFSSVAKRYNLSPSTVSYLFEKHVYISRKLLPKYLCIDECHAFSGGHGDYVCVLVDYLSHNTIDLLPSRKKAYLTTYFERIPLEERLRVKLVSIDMWETYRAVSKKMFPDAKVCVDKFHLISDLSKKVQTIRVRIMKKNYFRVNLNKLKEEAQRSDEGRKKYHEYNQKDKNYYLLKKFNWLLTLNYQKRKSLLDINNEKKYNKKLGRYLNLQDILDLILDIDQELKEAYYLYIDFDYFYQTSNVNNAQSNLERIIEVSSLSRSYEIVDFSNTLKRWKSEIINSFIVIETYVDKHGEVIEKKINNGIIENKNRTLKLLKNNASGYKNWERFRNRALFVLNKDATYYLNPIKEK